MDDFLWGLFISSFISSTLFPGGSEAVLAYLSSEQQHAKWLLLLVATTGNTLGGMTSWGIGWLIAKKYPTRQLLKPGHEDAIERIKKYGSPILLLSWLPVIGDPLCVAAGWLRVHWLLALVFIGVGKAARYGVIVYLF
jgi:membrane protein YqaA with SNARE-associated domain